MAGINWIYGGAVEELTGISHAKMPLTKVPNNLELTTIDFGGHSRVVGFRTTKKSFDSSLIKSIQPIYFSVDESICKNSVDQISSEGLLNEKQTNEII